MAYRRPPNLNTKYGRKRARQESYERYQQMSPEERADYDSTKAIITIVILIIVGLLVFLAKGSEGLVKWLSH